MTGADVAGVEPRPVSLLRRIKTEFPLTILVEAAYRIKATMSAEQWPNWCFIPRNVWVNIIDEFRKGYLDREENLPMVMQSHVLCTWRYGQGIYEFDPELLAALTDSNAPGKLPADVLLRLPEWCIYVPTSGLTFYGHELYGFFASLDYTGMDVDDHDVPCLEITADTSDGLLSVPLPIDNCTIPEAFERVVAFYRRYADDGGMMNIDSVDFELLEKNIQPLISLLLYLCSDAPEIENRKTPGTSPFRVQAKKVKGGFKWFPAAGPTVWSVGVEIGETLRKAGYSGGGGSKAGHHKRPHIRLVSCKRHFI